jgi:hypothetical protein
VNIEQMSVSEFDAGQGTTTPAAVTPLVAAGFGHKSYKFVRVRALATNAGSILVGPASLSASSGYPLAAGESIEIPIDSPEKVFVYATGAYGYEWLSA